MNSLEVYLESVIEQLKNREQEYLKGYVESHRDILKKIRRDAKLIKEMEDENIRNKK